MKKDILLFDLDGTLTDPMVGITKSVQYALKHYGIIEEDLKRLIPFIGPPLRESFMKYYSFSEEQAKEGVSVYREYFSTKGIFENEEIPGIRRMLEELKIQGKSLYVATSKPEVYARRILEHFGLSDLFTFIGGADMEETRVSKGAVIRYVLEKARDLEGEKIGRTGAAGRCEERGTNKAAELEALKKRVLMVGDREHDVWGARENAVPSVAVLFGYGSLEELEEAGADRMVESVEELTRVLLMDWDEE